MITFVAHVRVLRLSDGNTRTIAEKEFLRESDAMQFARSQKYGIEAAPGWEWDVFVNRYDSERPIGHQRVGEGVTV